MNKLFTVVAILLLLAACSAQSETPPKDVDPSANQVSSHQDDNPSPPEPNPGTASPESQPQTETETTKAVEPLVTFIELGAESCIPCRMMQPILKEVQDEYGGLVKVVFYDLNKERWAAQQYKVRVMPTQVFLDLDGREFFRHEGFFPKADIEKMLADRIGVTKPRKD